MAKAATASWQNAMLTVSVWTAVTVIFLMFAGLVGYILWHGIPQLSFEFLTTEPLSSGRKGGIGPILVSTGLILLVCIGASLPIGLGTAVLLSEFTAEDSLFGRLVRRSLDVLAGVPSIVFGLFGNAFFCKTLGLGFSIASGGLTLACMVLPILIRATEEGFRAVPQEYRLSASSLGFTKSATLWHLLLPAAVPGLIVGMVLGIGRAVAETAALIFTSGYVDRMPESLLDSGRALSIHIFDLSMNVAGGDRNAYATSATLVLLLILINGMSAWLADHWLRRRIVVI
jgi:phosphate transport system permease protein